MQLIQSVRQIRWYHGVALLGIICLALVSVLGYLQYQLWQAEKMAAPPFPVGVNPATKTIVEQPDVQQYFDTYLAQQVSRTDRRNRLARLSAEVMHYGWYQNLASPNSRILVIFSGERHEEVVDNFGDILGWDQTERHTFRQLVASSSPESLEGKYLPGSYIVDKDASPESVAFAILHEFKTQITDRYTTTVSEQVPLSDALIIASLLEREAYDFNDMRIISGVIWNRLFVDMPLQLDATLQYVKGSRPWGPWWPTVVPADKFIDSAYNTYQNDGLPPTPIANPSPDAVLAALNPLQTDCMFYFHDSNGRFYCNETYEGHVKALREVYGQGR